VDRLEKIQPYLEAAGYDMVYASGPRKKHGCMIAFRKDKFQNAGERIVYMDDAEKGASFKTKNIGSLVALRDLSAEGRGVVVSTTHLFWHPSSVRYSPYRCLA
jgi:RNA exonuclease NGL2